MRGAAAAQVLGTTGSAAARRLLYPGVMSSEEAPEADAAAGPPAAKPPTIVVALLGVNLLLSAGGLFMAVKKGKPAHAGGAEHAAEAGPPPREVTGSLITLDPFVVNLNEPQSSRYLKVQVQVEVANSAAVKMFDKSKQLIRDDLLSYLSGLKVADTLGAENKDKIRDALQTAVGDVIGEDRVHRVVFIEFVVQ